MYLTNSHQERTEQKWHTIRDGIREKEREKICVINKLTECHQARV